MALECSLRRTLWEGWWGCGLSTPLDMVAAKEPLEDLLWQAAKDPLEHPRQHEAAKDPLERTVGLWPLAGPLDRVAELWPPAGPLGKAAGWLLPVAPLDRLAELWFPAGPLDREMGRAAARNPQNQVAEVRPLEMPRDRAAVVSGGTSGQSVGLAVASEYVASRCLGTEWQASCDLWRSLGTGQRTSCGLRLKIQTEQQSCSPRQDLWMGWWNGNLWQQFGTGQWGDCFSSHPGD
ncbi:hypothetical protein SKAU_G00096310 [Synaphobranchus kaupii]|uniref:Uncharacterized protein n=1 Tax=Synaphobranchus kaupii TaxID=118154 RepID=A0A9Q1J707_SYNKA|nr:hypothetical protein SKAU_G00096310 [Synaphobranchus kaupii]